MTDAKKASQKKKERQKVKQENQFLLTKQNLRTLKSDLQQIEKHFSTCLKKMAFFENLTNTLKNNIDLCKVQVRNIKDASIFCEKVKKELTETKGLFKIQTDFIQESMNINSHIEETLVNVLLAIRQNEYLQAWHPESTTSKPEYIDQRPWNWAATRLENLNPPIVTFRGKDYVR